MARQPRYLLILMVSPRCRIPGPAARNLVNRAEAALVLLKGRAKTKDDGIRRDAGRVLDELRALRRETEANYLTRIKPQRTQEIMQWMYDSMETALEKAAGNEHPAAITGSGGNRFGGSASHNLFP